jgi:hypothetical protein
MTLAVENRLIRVGCLIVLIGTCVFGYLAIKVSWAYGCVAALLIPAWILVNRYRARVAGQIDLEALREIFRPTRLLSPILQRGGRYGYPVFTLIFPSKADLEAAKASGCIAAFKAFIQSRYAHVSFGGSPFDAEQAVNAIYEPTNKAGS